MLRECAVTRKIHRLSFARIVAMLALIGWLAGCGFKGPLYLPPPKTASSVDLLLCLSLLANHPIPTATT
jgi:predicted small lipoprotein YifL